MIPQIPDDLNLLKACIEGKTEAFGALVQKYQSYIRTLTYSATSDADKSEEIAQEVFIIAWQNLSQLRDLTKFKSWLYQITRNEIVKYYKVKKHDIMTHAASADTALQLQTASKNPLENAISREWQKAIHEALGRIPSHYREPLILFYWEGCSIRQVAQMYELNEDTAQKRISRARGMLKADIETMVKETLSRSSSCQTFSAAVIGLITAGALLKTSTASAAVTSQTTSLSAAGSIGANTSILTGISAKISTIAAAVVILTAATAYVLNKSTASAWPGTVIHALPEKFNSGLVLHFSFDNIGRQNGQTIIMDDSPAGNNGIFQSGQFSPGRFGQAFECSAIDKHGSIIVKDSDSLDLDAVTVAAWIKTNRLDDSWNRILDKDWQTAYNFCIGGEKNGKRWQDKAVFECAGTMMFSKGSVVDGRWHWVVGTYDGQVQKLYVDGKLDSNIVLKKKVPITHNNLDIHIGDSTLPEPPPNSETYFDGLIDEVRLYNRVLSEQEVRILFQYQPLN